MSRAGLDIGWPRPAEAGLASNGVRRLSAPLEPIPLFIRMGGFLFRSA